MKNYAIISASIACMWSVPALAQENWAGTPVPDVYGSSGTVSGSEYIVAQCNRRSPAVYCADVPSAVREVFIPISAFARSDSVNALADRADLQGADIAEMGRRQDRDRASARQGIAAAIAIGNAPMPSGPGRVSYDINVATYRGEQAVGGSFKYRLNLSDPAAISVGFSSSGKRNQAARIGVSGEF